MGGEQADRATAGHGHGKLRVSGTFLKVPRKSFVGVTKGEQPFFNAVADRYAPDPAWQVYQDDCGHDVMMS